MQMKESIQATIRLGVVLQLDTLTRDGEDAPITRIGVPYEVSYNKAKTEVYVRMYVTHELGAKGGAVELEEGDRKYRTIPLHKIMEGSLQRRRDLPYYPAPCK